MAMIRLPLLSAVLMLLLLAALGACATDPLTRPTLSNQGSRRGSNA